MLLLAALTALSLLAACQTGAPVEEGKKNEEGGENQINEGEPSTAEQRIYPDLEAVDFGGYEFKFYITNLDLPDWAEWAHRDLFTEAENGEPVNDAVYYRNKKIEAKYNIKITEIIYSSSTAWGLSDKVSTAVRAGDDVYDVVVPHVHELQGLMLKGNLIDFSGMPIIDLNRPWWNKGTIRDLSIAKKVFLLQGDLLIMDNDAMAAMIFNKKILAENQLETPYDIVKSGEWTFDKFLEMGRGIAKDLNGDGTMYIKDDLFGYVLQCGVDASFIVSGNSKICSKDADDLPIITAGTERFYKITDYLSEMLSDTENSVNLHSYEGKFPIYDEQVKMFSEDRVLFTWIRMRIVERLRGMETDFGIIPCPKLDKAQENYITYNEPNAGTGISIPRTAGDLERTAMILEDLSAESRYTLQPAYYEINLRGKYARDDESQEMLDIILANSAHDIGYIYNFGGFASLTCHRYGRDMKVDWVSKFEASEGKMQKDIDKLIETALQLD